MREPNSITRSRGAGVLSTLRALANVPYDYLSDAWQATELQARLLHDLLPDPIASLPTTITELIPTIAVELIESIPVAGTAFWGNGRWNIHLRAADDVDQQCRTLLHELKHIIDHPIRTTCTALSVAESEALADHFADVVLGTPYQPSEGPPADLAAV